MSLLYRLKWSVLKRLGPRRIHADVGGLKMALAFSDASARQMYFGEYEKEEAACIAAHIQPGMVVCDIGANLGYFTLLLAQLVGPQGRVYAFEPNPEMRARLQENLRLNPELSNGRVTVEELALGQKSAQQQFFCPVQGQEGVGGLRNTQRAPLREVITVNVEPLDEYVAAQRIERLDFIKLDVEGGELGVLRGAEYVLSKMRPVILFEACEENTAPYGYRVFELLACLEQRGYTVKQAGVGYNFLATPR